MPKIILLGSISLDGFMAGPNRELDWQLVDDELHDHMNAQLGQAGGFLEGRLMYELMASVWPKADKDPSFTRPMVEFASIWLEKPKYVFSRTLECADWNSTILRDVVPSEIEALKAQPGGDLVLGGADLTATFLQHDLIDEVWLYVHPVVLGQGMPLFRTSTPLRLRLVETHAFTGGVVRLRYTRSGTG